MKEIRLYLTLVIIAMLPTMASAQNVIDPKGDMYFDAGCYPKALAEYMKAYVKRPDNTKLMRQIAATILADESPRETAIIYIERYLASDSTADQDIEAYYMAAQAHFYGHNFSKARKYIENYKAMVTKEEDMAKAGTLSNWIASAQSMLKDTLKNHFVNLGPSVNTSFNEINPYIMPDNKALIFSADDKYNSAEIMNYFNVKATETEDLGWGKSKAVTGMVNTLYDEYTCGMGGGHVLFNSNRDVQFSIFDSRYIGKGRMGDGEPFGPSIDQKGDEVAGTISESGDTLIFSATCSNGKLDLFYSIKFNGEWMPSRPLPGQINAEDSDENYPYLTSDGKRLYFSSDRQGTMGGMDLYYSDYDANKKEWGKPVHLKYPINDCYDNYTISFTSDKRYAYVSAIRPEGLGGRDIYAVVSDKVMPTVALMRCTLCLKAKPKPIPLGGIPLIEVTDETGEVVAQVKMKSNTSTCILTLDPGTYTLNIEADNAKPYKEQIVVPEKYYDQQTPIEKLVILEPLQ